jgi:hypothetical protein
MEQISRKIIKTQEIKNRREMKMKGWEGGTYENRSNAYTMI